MYLRMKQNQKYHDVRRALTAIETDTTIDHETQQKTFISRPSTIEDIRSLQVNTNVWYKTQNRIQESGKRLIVSHGMNQCDCAWKFRETCENCELHNK